MTSEEFNPVYSRLRAILIPYAPDLKVTVDAPAEYYLETGYSEKWKKPLFFGSAAIKRSYVSFYLMPVYMFPEMLDGISPGLKKRMQGKSCFNFKAVDENLFAELETLTRSGFEKFRQEGLV